jgi:hypothetical protein
MSEYQYYEFQALDRPLTQEQISWKGKGDWLVFGISEKQ